jgi:hypothetical protein
MENLLTFLAEKSVRLVYNNAIDPDEKRAAAVKARERELGFHENPLSDLVGVFAVREDSVRNSVDAGLVSFDELAISHLLGGLRSPNQVALRRVRLLHWGFTFFDARFNEF